MKDIFKQIRDERADFLQNEIEVVPGYNFSQYHTIKKIHLYFNSLYEKSNYEDVNGVLKKKVFHNLSRWRCEVATKMIDMDVKDFILVSNKMDTDWQVFLLEKELKVWLKKSKMGQLLNEISRLLPIYGSVVLEKTASGAQIVDLRNLYIDQSASCLEDARYILKRNLFSHQDLRKMSKKGWDNVSDAIRSFSGKYRQGYDLEGVSVSNNGSSLFYEGSGTQNAMKADAAPLVEVFCRWGEVPKSWFTDLEEDEDEYVLAKYYVTGVDEYQENDEGVIIAEDGLVLYKEMIDELSLKEVHYSKTEGRWLGQGVVEILFESQRRINEVKNFEASGNELGSLQVFQTEDETVASNITTDLNSGDILKVKSPITPIMTELRNAAQLEAVARGIEEHSDNLTFSRDVVSGETAPASSTLGAVQIQTQQTAAVFDYKKENIGLFMGEFIKDLVYPEIEKDLNKEHVFRLAGTLEELTKLRNNFATAYANKRIIDHALKGDPTDENTPDLDQQLFKEYHDQGLKDIGSMGDKIWVEVMGDFFDNLDYEVDIVSTGENKNLNVQMQNANNLLMVLSKDPTMLTDPIKKKILFKIMASMGWHISELEQMASASPTLGPDGLPIIPGQTPANPQDKTEVPGTPRMGTTTY